MAPYKHVLCSTDFSEPAEKGAIRAAEVAKQHGARLTFLHVVEHFPENLPVTMSAREDQDPKTHLMAVARAKLAELAERVGARDAGQVVVISRRSARHEILNYATENGVDLLVLGALPHGILGTLGSTASGILNVSPCDLLVVRDGVRT